VTAFKGRRNGELVGAFGVSVSTAGLHQSVVRTRLAAAGIGLGALAVIALIVTYFVHRSILMPLSELAGAIGSMGQGDLMARAPVRSRDEIGQLAETFNGMVAQLRQANQNYMEVLAFVSHELKNPIASMLTDARVLADGYLGPVEPAQVRKLERLIGMGHHLLELIREYLDLTQMESGNLAFRPQMADLLGEVVDPAVELILPQIQDRRMTLERLHPDAFRPVHCDPHLLKIVLVNLLGNAVKYGRPEGAIRLALDLGAGRLRITVWNEGPGFPAEERPRLFRKFSRLQAPELAARKGTGIGLYTAWRIAAMHGGNMDARSEQGRWAEFSLEIPQPLPVEADAPPGTSAGIRSAPGLF
jgi:signal transduction histidine kinase